MSKELAKRIDASNKIVSYQLEMRRNDGIVFTTKLGTAKGVERSRIWIEGPRLAAAGFEVGTYFAKDCGHESHHSTMTLTLLSDDDVLTTAPCKVSGKGAKPIIDITGDLVARTFGALGTHVEVTFKPGVIVIRAVVA